MMDTKEDPGFIPWLCEALFPRVEQKDEHERIYRLTFSYLEIYNERVRGLLKPTTSASRLRVREHPRLGPYVQGLSHHVVRTLGSLMSYVQESARAKKTTSTLQDSANSRSHALLTVALSQKAINAEHSSGSTSSSKRQDATPRGGNRLHLIDLAGSESAATCDDVHRLKEGANINKSLVALGNVISALTERDSTGSGPSRRYIPYRDSSLTCLLKDALGGNATTIMLATISPVSGDYNEIAHALRFKQRAQSVVDRPVVNEDPVARLICELRDEVTRLKSLLLEKDIDQQAKALCCCGKIQSSEDSTIDDQYREEQEALNISLTRESDSKNDSVRSKDETSLDVLSIRRFNSSDSVTTRETGSSSSIRKFSSYEQLQSPNRFISNYNQAEVTELNDEENEVVDEINEPVFVDIPTLVAVLIKPDDNLRESLTQIEEICSDELQEDPIDVDFIKDSNEEFDGAEKIDNIDSNNRKNSINFCNALGDSSTANFHQTLSECLPSSPAHAERSKPRSKISKQNSIDLSSSNLNVSKRFGSIEGISKRKEPIFGLQRSHTNLEKQQTLLDRRKKLNNIREIDDRKVKSGNIWKTISNAGSKDNLQRKSSNDSDKSLKDTNSGKASYNNIGKKPSLENLRRKTSKDSSSSSSKEEQILISSSTRDKLLRRKSSLDRESISGARHHTAIQRVKRAEIVAAVTERLYSSRKNIEEINMASNNTSDTRSPPEGTDVKPLISSGFAARSKLQEISRKMLLKRRRINVETQTETASTLRFKDTASLTDEPKVVLLDAAVLTDDHAACDVAVATYRLPVLRVKDVATLTDRPRTSILRYRDAESSANDLNFDDYELHSPRNDSGILSDDMQNNTESNLFSAEVFDLDPESDKRVPCTDSSTNTFLSSPGRNSAVQTTVRREVVGQHKNAGCSQCCSLAHELNQRAPMNTPDKNVISISLPDMLNITIESTNALESKIAVMDSSDTAEEKPKSIFKDKECQTDEQAKNKAAELFFSEDPSVKSTAVQADGRTFRIENIFQDTRNENYSDATSDLKKEIATKKSVTFRNSLGVSSIIETKRNDMEMEWDKMHIPDFCQSKRQILKGSLTQAFIARKHSYNLSHRKPANKLMRYDLWKNWTFPFPEKSSNFIDFNIDEKIVNTFPPVQQNINLKLVDDLSVTDNECIPIDKTIEERIHESSDQLTNFKDLEKLKSVSVRDLSDHYDHNFSDDSLDYDEDNIAIKATDTKIVDSQISANYENICPPDVVAHTKKEILKSATHIAEVAFLKDVDFENTEEEFLKRKSEISDKNSINEYKSLTLGSSSYVVNSDPVEETNVKTLGLYDNINKKKVSFLNPSTSEDINNVMVNHKTSRLKQSTEVALKSVIKKIKKLDATKNLNIIQLNVETNQSLRTRKESMESEEVLSVSDENQDSEDLEELLDNKKAVFSNEKCTKGPCNESNSVLCNESSCAMLKRDILKEYLNEAMIFMRNMNSINEYMNATNILESCEKHRKKRRDHQANYRSMNKDYVKYRGRKVSLKDDTDKYLRMDKEEIVPDDFYEECLRGIERLETSIDKVNKHNQVLRDRYGIDVESAGAKPSLANPSIDFRTSAVTKNNVIHQCKDTFVEDDVNESSTSETPSSFLSSTQDNIVKQFNLHERGTDESDNKIDKQDVDKKNNDITSEGDLKRRIFDQLMDAADSRCWSLRKSRQRRPWKMFNPRSHSPTTYSKFRETLRQDTRAILNFNEVHPIEDYLNDIHSIDNNSHDFKKTKLSETTEDIESRITIEPNIGPGGSCDRDKSPIENNSPLEIEAPNDPTIFETRIKYPNCLINPSNSIDVERKFYEEDEIMRRNTELKDYLKINSINHRSAGSLNMALKYPGSSRAKFLELLRERRRIVENSRGTNAF